MLTAVPIAVDRSKLDAFIKNFSLFRHVKTRHEGHQGGFAAPRAADNGIDHARIERRGRLFDGMHPSRLGDIII